MQYLLVANCVTRSSTGVVDSKILAFSESFSLAMVYFLDRSIGQGSLAQESSEIEARLVNLG